MRKLGKIYGQEGSVTLIIAIVALALALIGTAGFAYSLYNSRQDYKNNSDKKVSDAVDEALTLQKTQLQNQFADEAKSPTLTYTGPATYGSITFKYPRTWNGYVDTTSPTDPIKGFFYNGIVPAGVGAYSLRIQLLSQDYNSVITTFSQNIKKGTVTASAYVPPKMAGVKNAQTGTRFDGQIETSSQNNPIQGSAVILKVRDKTFEILTELPASLNDFNNTILASLAYVP